MSAWHFLDIVIGLWLQTRPILPNPAQASKRSSPAATQETVVEYLIARVRESRHVRTRIRVDSELAYVAERDAPGVDRYRSWLEKALAGQNVNKTPHEEIIAKLDQAAQMFSVLIVKTDMTIPYTSVFFELDCGYWNETSESRLRAAIREQSDSQSTS